MRTTMAAILAGTTCLAAASTPEGPCRPDAHAAVLLHFDGDSRDGGTWENHAKPRGEVAFAQGKFGKALSLDGRGGLVIPADGTTYVGQNSWTAECWFRPSDHQPVHAVLVAGGWGHERHWFIRLSSAKHLAACFSCGSLSGTVVSPDVSPIIFDGEWHHVAAVLDRASGGEVRLYLDGEPVPTARPAVCPPIIFDDERMGIAVGAITPWNIGEGGYRGLIDELRVSNMVRPAYRVGKPLPEKPASPARPQPRLPVDASVAAEPLALAPETTILVLPDRRPGQGNFDAAQELQHWLRAACCAEQGFEIVQEGKLESIRHKAVLALGPTQWVDDSEIAGLPPAGFLLRRKANVVLIVGGKSMGTYHGAMRLLDDVAGVRFYMPTERFTSQPKSAPKVPVKLDLRVEPFVCSAMMSGIADIPGDGGWSKRNGVARRLGGTHQHNMFAMFNPRRCAETHPDVYPVLDGRRYVPGTSADQRWQPCLSSPSLVDVAEEAAIRYFRKNPSATYVAFSVQDSHVVCQCDACREAYAEHAAEGISQQEAQARGFSRLYWKFVDAVARRMEASLPAKKVVALVYGPARFPPEERLPPNVILFTNFHVAELDADRILAPDPATGISRLDQVLQRCALYGNHDWYHGNGFLMPRVYSGYWSRYMRHLADRVDAVYMHAEAYPNWGLDGPKLYIAARLWWDPRRDVEELLDRFCQDMFGPAAEPMHDHFAALERLWVTLDNVKGPERKLFQWDRQFTADAADRGVIGECRTLLDRAASMARTDHERRRIALFAKTFVVPETLYRFAAAKTIPQTEVDRFWQHVESQILPDPMTLFGAGRDPQELRKRIEAAVSWATDRGMKVD